MKTSTFTAMLKTSALLTSAFMVLCGCSVTILPVKKEPTVENYLMPAIAQEDKTKLKIAIVGADFTAITAPNTDRIKPALAQAVKTIIQKKGFDVIGEFNTLYDVSDEDKQKSYLAITLRLYSFNAFEVDKSQINYAVYYETRGSIALEGVMIVDVFEPVSGELFITKRLNLAEFKIAKPYIQQKQFESSDVFDDGALPTYLTDSKDKAMSDLHNEFFTKAVNKIALELSRNELLALRQKVAELKNRQKR
jgi:hypothetical protein